MSGDKGRLVVIVVIGKKQEHGSRWPKPGSFLELGFKSKEIGTESESLQESHHRG